MKLDPVSGMALGVGATFLGRFLWDAFMSGRVEKGVYVKIEDCTKNRDKCCVGQLKKNVATHEEKLASNEKRLDKGSQDFKKLQEDISDMKSNLAGMRPLVEMMAAHVMPKE